MQIATIWVDGEDVGEVGSECLPQRGHRLDLDVWSSNDQKWSARKAIVADVVWKIHIPALGLPVIHIYCDSLVD